MSRRPFLGPVERLVLIRDGFYSPDPACRRRAVVLLAVDRGSTLSAAARSAGCNRDSVYRWLAKYLRQRDPAALRDARRRDPGRPSHRRRAQADGAAALVALVRSAPGGGFGSGSGPGRLGLDRSARAVLDAAAGDLARPPRTRLRAAILAALDRGFPISTIARAAGCDRHTVRAAPARHLARLLADRQ